MKSELMQTGNSYTSSCKATLYAFSWAPKPFVSTTLTGVYGVIHCIHVFHCLTRTDEIANLAKSTHISLKFARTLAGLAKKRSKNRAVVPCCALSSDHFHVCTKCTKVHGSFTAHFQTMSIHVCIPLSFSCCFAYRSHVRGVSPLASATCRYNI